MRDVCAACHNEEYVDAFYIQYDGIIDLYNNKFAKPGQELMEAAKPLKNPIEFSTKLDFVWFELWHHEGRRVRHAASMMGPDYTHWHGTYDLAKNFYTEMIPALEELVEANLEAKDPEKVKAAKNLRQVIDKVLSTDDHKWFLGKLDEKEGAARKKAADEFKARYAK
jgi:hypothetical protein